MSYDIEQLATKIRKQDGAFGGQAGLANRLIPILTQPTCPTHTELLLVSTVISLRELQLEIAARIQQAVNAALAGLPPSDQIHPDFGGG
jgi:hypothetical protein